MKSLFDNLSHEISRLTTRRYSTSFSLGIYFLNKGHHKAIYGIYGFVRFADEIVDSFHDFDKKKLFDDFSADTFHAIANKISLNPILNSFQWAVNKYNIPHELIHSFLNSMEMDLNEDAHYDEDKFKEYILGSAEVVGLMCLKVFVEGNEENYKKLKPNAMSLGSAFQKINFLRDLKNDFHSLGRSYFPDVDLNQFNDQIKKELEIDILKDFEHGYEGILKLPKKSKMGVYIAYIYYFNLFKKIKKTSAKEIMHKRIRISNKRKTTLLFVSYLKLKLKSI